MTRNENIALVTLGGAPGDELAERVTRGGFACQAFASPAALAAARHVPALVLLAAPGADRAALVGTIGELRQAQALEDATVLVLRDRQHGPSPATAFGAGADDVADIAGADDDLWARIEARLRHRRATDGPSREARGAAMVLELTQALSSALHIRDILYLVVQRVAEVVSVDRASIVLAHLDEPTAYVITASDDRELRDLPVRLADYPEIGQVLASGEPLVIRDAADHPLFDLSHRDVPRRFRSLGLVPICFEDRTTGVLFLRSREPRALDADALFLLRAVANATGIALRNARLVQTLRDQSRRTEHARKAAEQRLRRLEPYAEFFRASADGIMVIDPGGRVLFCNPAACAVLGRRESELEGCAFDELLAKDSHRRFERLRESFAHGVFPSNVDLAVRTGHAERRVLSVSFNSVLREDGVEDSGIIVSLRDVTEDRATARELTKTKEFLQRVIDSSVDAVVSADMRGAVRLFNPAAERVYGYKAAEVVGRMNVTELYPEGTAREIMRLIRSPEMGGEGQLRGLRTVMLGAGGIQVPVLLSAALIMHRGRPIGSVGVFTDLRERLAIEGRLLATQQELAVQAKKAVIAELAGATAHELNQPLTTVMGYADLLGRRLQGGQLGQASDAIVRETERMAEIVRKIGKLTHYETKPYVGEAQILDLDRSADSDAPGRSPA
ncbi:MAG: PAS domain S-box protein [Polyangiaceae bacterium]|nr:PAS domain S-box protein [Polyangiaceae bacterium]